jgi:subtilisin family serine protease
MKMKQLLAGLVISLTVALPLAAWAEPPAGTFPVIVVLHDHVNFQSFSGFFHADDRAQANPAAWGYLDHGVAGAVQALEATHGFRADHVYSHALRGFAARLTARQIDALERTTSMVAYVEADGTMTAVAQTLPWGISRIGADVSSTLAGNGSGAVTNVNAYIIDTGIDTAHADLYVVKHVNFAGGVNKDCHGHGTHVSGTVAARDNTIDVVGVAPGAPLTGVKVLGCGGSGTTSGVIKGVDWVTANKGLKPAVANMSLGGGASPSLDTAVINSANSGVFYALAAGNSGADACNSSPARAGAGTNNGIMTVAATDINDQEPSWSNYGSCVDTWGPGVNILSTRKGGGTTTMSGTSMASPHVAGTAALYLSTHTTADPIAVEGQLKSDAFITNKTSKDGSKIEVINAGGY